MVVYDISGKLLTILTKADQQAGDYTVEWNGYDSNGSLLESGIYYCLVEARTEGQVYRQVNEIIISR